MKDQMKTELLHWVMQNPSHASLSVRLVEQYLTLEWLKTDMKSPMTITRPQVMAEFGIVADTYRRIIGILAASGRWEIVRGVGSNSTTFKPLFPASIIGGAN